MKRKFLLGVGIAASVLSSNSAFANNTKHSTTDVNDNQINILTMENKETSTLMMVAGHSSHSSHASHGSHGSHSSHSSGF